ncbi:hypothetical protein HYS31_06815, partial [Candidatus Woesearchaeota archaeon]|nr:hypothetical protein [Candidatus Woesearchaeota archaeon]
EIAALKEFIKNQELFLNIKEKKAVFVSDENEGGVKVYDYLNNDANKDNYGKQNDLFMNIVRHALNDTMFTEINYNITTANNIVLRARNLKPDFSSDYLLYLNSSNDISLPVVMSGGIWADITAWNDLGSELSSNGRDIWLIEITGGPDIECNGCVNYNYTDLVDDFWPSLIGGVQGITGKNKIQYVAHSNGCRTALDSLSNWSSSGKASAGKVIYNGTEINLSMSLNPVETFVGVACPGNFSELSYFARQVNLSGGVAIERLRMKGNLHPKFGDVAHEMESSLGEVAGITRFFNNPRLSLNLFQQYYDWIRSDEDRQPGKISLNKFALVYGDYLSRGSDLIVSAKDEKDLFDKINSNNKTKLKINIIHVGMSEDNQVKDFVKKSIQ